LDFEISLFIFFMNLTTLELDTLYFYFIKLGHFIPTAPLLLNAFFRSFIKKFILPQNM